MSDYAFEGPRWSSSTITWSFAPAGGVFTNAISSAYQSNFLAAMARWSQVANVTFKQVPDSTIVNVRIGWGSFGSTELGETDFSYVMSSAQTQIFLAGTTLRIEDPAVRAVGTGKTDYYQGTVTTLYQTVLHEIGHALGLAHSLNAADVMYASLGPSDPDLGAADIQGIQLLYGAPAGSASVATVTTAVVPTVVNLATAVIAVYRFFDTSTGTQFLTASVAERDNVIATRSDLTYEGLGLGGITPGTDTSAVPVYRFFDTKTGTHFFTSSESEQANLVTSRPDLVLEQTTFYEHASAQNGDAPVYRFFDKNDGTHFYTASDSERTTVAATRPDMAYEGIAFYSPTTTG